jgi:predicted house-cleaning NTP pyrophosphatase (Maf/HAM1 superfamily)
MENEPDIMYASGFIIETILSNFIEKIDGSYYNILGIPVEKIYKHIKDMGYNLKDLEC